MLIEKLVDTYGLHGTYLLLGQFLITYIYSIRPSWGSRTACDCKRVGFGFDLNYLLYYFLRSSRKTTRNVSKIELKTECLNIGFPLVSLLYGAYCVMKNIYV